MSFLVVHALLVRFLNCFLFVLFGYLFLRNTIFSHPKQDNHNSNGRRPGDAPRCNCGAAAVLGAIKKRCGAILFIFIYCVEVLMEL